VDVDAGLEGSSFRNSLHAVDVDASFTLLKGWSFRNSLPAVDVDAPTTLLTPVCGGLVHMETYYVFILSPLPLGMGTIDLLKRFNL
jgi:hypothetical protein